MEILGYNVSRSGVYNVEKRAFKIEKARLDARNKANEDFKKKAKNVTARVNKMALSRIKASITSWKNARQVAESETYPDNRELIRVFKDIEIDAHLWALIQTLRLKVLANKFALYTPEGEIDEDATEMFTKKWFRCIIKETVDADIYGFSLIQLGDIINSCFSTATLVPREYVVQQKGGVKKNLGSAKDLISYEKGAFSNWLIPIGDKRELGLLDKAAPLVIKKKEVLSAWSEAAEVFGMPIRIGKTNIKDPENRENMEDMLENMGEAAWGVFAEEDDIELKDTNKTDFSNMYDKFIERVNSELSKLILLQTGTTDEKAHVGSATVHENILKDVIESYILKVEDLANEKVLPLCVRHGLVSPGVYIKANNEQKLTPKELFDIVKELLPHYKIKEDWINETFEVPVEEKEVTEPPTPGKEEIQKITDPEAKATSVMRAMAKLYGGVLNVVEEND